MHVAHMMCHMHPDPGHHTARATKSFGAAKAPAAQPASGCTPEPADFRMEASKPTTRRNETGMGLPCGFVYVCHPMGRVLSHLSLSHTDVGVPVCLEPVNVKPTQEESRWHACSAALGIICFSLYPGTLLPP